MTLVTVEPCRAMGAYEELTQTGSAGPETVRLVDRMLRAVIRRHNYPPPSGNEEWDSEELADIRQAFIAERGTERFAQLYALALDEASLRRLLAAAVHRFLADRTRQTRKGKLFVRFRADLQSDSRFEEVKPGRWAVRGGPTEPGEFDEDRLTTIAWRLDLRVSPWGEDTSREGPPADKASRLLLLESMLRAADGSLTVAQLAAVGERRFPFYGQPNDVSYDGWDEYVLPAAPPADAGIGASEEGRRIWDALTPSQRAAVPHLELSARDAATAMGMGRTAANALQRQTKAALKDLLGPDPDDAVAAELMALVGDGLRTDDTGSPSQVDAEGIHAARSSRDDEDDRA